MLRNQILFVFAFMVCCAVSLSSNGSPYQDSLQIKGNDKTLNFEDRFDALTDLGFTYYGNNPDKLFEYANQALDLARENNDELRTGIANMLIGIGYIQTTEFHLSTLHLQKALEIFQEVGNPKYAMQVYSNLSIVKQEIGDYEQAVYFLLEALKQAEKLNDSRAITVTLVNLSLAYNNIKEFDKALERFKEAEEIAVEENDSVILTTIQINLANTYILTEEYEKAFTLIDSILPGVVKNEDLKSELAIYSSLGTLYLKKEEYKEALKFTKKQQELAKQLNNVDQEYSANNNMGTILAHLGNFKLGERYLLTNLDSLKTTDYTRKKLETLKSLVDFYTFIGNYKKAFEFNEQYQTLNDSILAQHKQVQIASLEAKYENYKNENTIAELQKNQQISTLRQRSLLLTLVAVFLFGGFLVYFQFSRSRRKSQQIKNEQLLNKQLQENHDTKVRFFTNISHEFRTPLTLIQGYLEQLIEKKKTKLNIHEINLMHRNSKRLQHLTNQILEISRIESGLVKLNLSKLPVLEFIRHSSEVFKESAKQHKLNLSVDIVESEEQAYVDEDKLIKILSNLISNAIKYNKEGGLVSITAKLEPKNYVSITVTDTGIGINWHELKNIFNRYYMAKPVGNAKSMGIGLSLVKELVDLYEGSIDVKSEQGKGSSFFVKLPVNPDVLDSTKYQIVDLSNKVESHVQLNRKDDEEYHSPGQKTVLLVEDNRDIIKYISNNIGEQYNIIEAVNGKDGLEKALKIIPDLIITDIMMPIMDGIELSKQLKNNTATDHIPIVMLTAKGESDSRIKGLETGADDYIAKPFNLKELKIRMGNLIQQREMLKEKFSKIITLGDEKIEAKSKDEVFLAKALKIVEDNYQEFTFTTEFFLKEMAMSRMQLHRKLKALTGASTSEFIRTIRLKKAHKLIEKDSGNISEIAYQVGFNDPAYFTRCFRQHFGYSPTQLTLKSNAVTES